MAKVTLQSIADKVGVSRMTVSNAFSRPDQLSSELRRKILDTAADLGYVGPDPAARALARGRTGSVGMLINGRVGEAFATDGSSDLELLSAVADELSAHGMAVTLLTPQLDEKFFPARDVAIDAAIVYSCNAETSGLAELQQRGIPMVTIDENPRPGIPPVNIDDRGGARAAAQHLVDLGHRRVGILALQDAEKPGAADDLSTMSVEYPESERMAGWREVLDAADAEVVTRLAPLAPRSVAAEVAADLLDQGVTAVLCFSDVFAHGVLTTAAARGLRVPDDVSVVGFDDTELAAALNPPLTTVRQDVAAKGRAAVTTLVARLAGQAPEAVVLPTELVIRRSTTTARPGRQADLP
ncbi:LacI family DNA-binding transcriptional regulator [Myceligenerans pegani]|uniref:LacI family DNA-binding transcriptional regulator n=1 Tax=Myceligenerans pegani TaxID=2776917 RepID=A0ABR9MZ22_9MICO|nr:LacI family DNA-binding transcriptional regulator [Myceligenerans sp. TRM 65318]MBE1876645.1 LacI family DNA-binding transcriptional regulator [Myceligenerans sp. TRM 65318]MBE3018916.1 LacI family DNA-binding transcriptional regulator [Myceligenerans sp. TRM 65318]